MVEVERLKYEVEIDTSTLGPQLAMAQTQIGSALSPETIGAMAPLARPAGGIGLGPEISLVGATGNIQQLQSQIFAQGVSGDIQRVQYGLPAVPQMVVVPQAVPMPVMPPQPGPAAPGMYPTPGMRPDMFAPTVEVGPMAMLLGRRFIGQAAPWVTAQEEARAVSMARRDFLTNVGWAAADITAFGIGGAAGGLGAGALGITGLLGGAVGLGAGFLASALVGAGADAVRQANMWRDLYTTMGVGAADAAVLSRELQGYGTGFGATFGRGVLEALDITGFVWDPIDRAEMVAARYGLSSRAARTDPEFLLRQGAFAARAGLAYPTWGDMTQQMTTAGGAVDALMTAFRVEESEARQMAAQFAGQGITMNVQRGIGRLREFTPILSAFVEPGLNEQQVRMMLMTEIPRLGRDPNLWRGPGGTANLVSQILQSRQRLGALFQGTGGEGLFGNVQNLYDLGITQSTVLSDITGMAAAMTQDTTMQGISAAIFGQGWTGPVDVQGISSRLDEILGGDIEQEMHSGISALRGGTRKDQLLFMQRGRQAQALFRESPEITARVLQVYRRLYRTRLGIEDQEEADLLIKYRLGISERAFEEAVRLADVGPRLRGAIEDQRKFVEGNIGTFLEMGWPIQDMVKDVKIPHGRGPIQPQQMNEMRRFISIYGTEIAKRFDIAEEDISGLGDPWSESGEALIASGYNIEAERRVFEAIGITGGEVTDMEKYTRFRNLYRMGKDISRGMADRLYSAFRMASTKGIDAVLEEKEFKNINFGAFENLISEKTKTDYQDFLSDIAAVEKGEDVAARKYDIQIKPKYAELGAPTDMMGVFSDLNRTANEFAASITEIKKNLETLYSEEPAYMH